MPRFVAPTPIHIVSARVLERSLKVHYLDMVNERVSRLKYQTHLIV